MKRYIIEIESKGQIKLIGVDANSLLEAVGDFEKVYQDKDILSIKSVELISKPVFNLLTLNEILVEESNLFAKDCGYELTELVERSLRHFMARVPIKTYSLP